MAISARFSADFSSFNDAVNKAEIELRGFEGAAGKVESALSRMTDNFSGRKMITDATLMAQAVENVGGVTKLTANELAKVGASAQEAAAKFRAWGQDVPPKIQAIADSVKNAEANTRSWASQLSSLGGIFGVTLSAAGIVGFANELLRTGDELVRVADRTGLTTVEVQKLQFIASQSGNTIDELTGAIGKLQKNLTLGDAGAVSAVKQLGLNLDQLKSESPYQQMADLAAAIEQVPDPAQRATLAIQLFGKSGAAILPTLVAQFKALGDEAPVMSDNTVRALDRAGDALNKFGQQIKVWAAESYNALSGVFDRLTAASLKFAAVLMPSITNQKLLSDTANLLVSHLSDQETAVRKTATAFSGDFEPKVAKATKAVKEHAAEVIGLGEGEKTLTGTLQLQQAQLQRYYERLEQIIPATKDWASLLPTIPGDIIETTAALKDFSDIGEKVAIETLPGMATGSGIAETAFEHLGGVLKDSVGGLNDIFQKAFEGGGGTSGAIKSFATNIGKNLLSMIPIVGPFISQFAGAITAGISRLFGGPSKDELAAREVFAQQYSSAQDAIDKVGSAYAKMGKSGTEAQQDLQRAFDATHISASAESAALQIINDKLADGKTKADALIATSAPDFENLTQAAAKYGISLEALGPQFQQASISKTAGDIVTTFESLKGAGGDVGGVLLGMSDEINQLVLDAKKFGSSLPTALEPLVKNLADTGHLVDENGDKITDLTGIKFADSPVANGIDGLTKAITDLTKTLVGPGGATDAIKKIGSTVSDTIPKNPFGDWKIPPIDIPAVDVGSYGSTGGYVTPMGVQHFGKGGRVLPFYAARGTDTVPAMLTPGEMVLTKAQQKNWLTSGASQPLVITVISQLDGREVSRAVTKVQTRDLQSRRKLGAA